MQQKKNRYEFLSDDLKREYLQKIIGFFHDQRNEEIGVIKAEETLEFFVDLLGDDLYKKTVDDCIKIVKQRNEDTEIELESLSIH